MRKKDKIRVNITVDATLLKEAKKKLNLFGGKLSTLFNAYLREFVESANQHPTQKYQELENRIKHLEKKIGK